MFKTSGFLEKDLVYSCVKRSRRITMLIAVFLMVLALFLAQLLLILLAPSSYRSGLLLLSGLLDIPIFIVGYFAQLDMSAKKEYSQTVQLYGSDRPEITTLFTEDEVQVFCGEKQFISLSCSRLTDIWQMDSLFLLSSKTGQLFYIFTSRLSPEEKRSFLQFLRSKTKGMLGLRKLLQKEGIL